MHFAPDLGRSGEPSLGPMQLRAGQHDFVSYDPYDLNQPLDISSEIVSEDMFGTPIPRRLHVSRTERLLENSRDTITCIKFSRPDRGISFQGECGVHTRLLSETQKRRRAGEPHRTGEGVLSDGRGWNAAAVVDLDRMIRRVTRPPAPSGSGRRPVRRPAHPCRSCRSSSRSPGYGRDAPAG